MCDHETQQEAAVPKKQGRCGNRVASYRRATTFFLSDTLLRRGDLESRLVEVPSDFAPDSFAGGLRTLRSRLYK